MNLSDSRYCKALLGIARAYAESVYARTTAIEVSASLLGPRKLPFVPESFFITSLTEPLPPETESLVKHAAAAWEEITARYGFGQEPFPNVYALLFFLEVLAVGRKLLYRGQQDAQWDLKPTLARRLEEGWDPNAIVETKKQYIDRVHDLPDRKHVSLTGPELEALCQHYGLPTVYLDFTWSATIAAFFALGGAARYTMPGVTPPPTGAIWVFDAMGESSDAVELVSLPSQVMRPWLQRGEFLNFKSLIAAKNPPKMGKFVFRHQPDIWVEELYDLGPYSSTPLSIYLIPRRDPLEEVAEPIRSQLAKDQAEKGNAVHDWFEFYRKFVDRAVHDLAPNRQGVDFQMAVKLVKGSPKQAQITIQVLWHEYEKLKSKDESGHKKTVRLHCCSLGLAYLTAFGPQDESTRMIFQLCPGLDKELSLFGSEQKSA